MPISSRWSSGPSSSALADPLELVELGLLERLARVGEDGARVHHPLVEERLEQAVAEVVVGRDVAARSPARVLRHQARGALDRPEEGLEAAAQGVERAEVATRDPAQLHQVAARPEPVDVPLAEARAPPQRPQVGPRVAHLQPGAQVGRGRAEREGPPALRDLEPATAQAREPAQHRAAGELDHRGLNPRASSTEGHRGRR